jgi:hypothetical protein
VKNDLVKIRSGSVRRPGDDALFATPRSVSKGWITEAALEAGMAPGRSATDAEVRVGDVLITLRGPVNAAAPVTGAFSKPLFATLELAVLRPGVQLDPTYLAWFINLPQSQAALAPGRAGGAVPRLPLPTLQTLPLLVPPLRVQQQIAAMTLLSLEETQLTTRLMALRTKALEAHLVDLLHQHSTGDAVPCMQ